MRLLLLVLIPWALAAQAPAWDYSARLAPSADSLSVEARFEPGDADRFIVDDDCAAFVKGLEREKAGRWLPVLRNAEGWDLPGAEREGAHLRWTFVLAAASHGGRHLSGVRGQDGTWLARTSTFLLRPARYHPDRPARLRMAVPEGLAFLSGIHPGSEPGSWEGATEDFDDPPYSALGRWRLRSLPVQGGVIEVAEPAAGTPLDAAAADAWIRHSAALLVSAYGRFPVKRAALFLTPVDRGSGVVFGTASGHGGAGVIVLLGHALSKADLDRDWVLPHELVHLALADLPEGHRWLEEGLPTYLEPLFRLRSGELDAKAFWAGLRKNLPQGQPRAGDRGLDRTPTWGRTYWGGAMFCFLADLRIRERSGGRKTLLDALRGILDAGLNAERRSDLREVLRAGDRALGFEALMPLYDALAEQSGPVDLEALWGRLGVTGSGFDDAAPESALRKAWGR
ncbi:MAG TPA: hypothetical protein VJ600_08590 [Holophagaceae bacterium]|nr:hypothetical protein [Holophagaceae bacterium]